MNSDYFIDSMRVAQYNNLTVVCATLRSNRVYSSSSNFTGVDY